MNLLSMSRGDLHGISFVRHNYPSKLTEHVQKRVPPTSCFTVERAMEYTIIWNQEEYLNPENNRLE